MCGFCPVNLCGAESEGPPNGMAGLFCHLGLLVRCVAAIEITFNILAQSATQRACDAEFLQFGRIPGFLFHVPSNVTRSNSPDIRDIDTFCWNVCWLVNNSD